MARSIIGSLWNPAQRNELNRMLEELYSDLGTATGTKNKLDNFLAGTGVVSKKMLASGSVDGTKIEDSSIFSNHMRLGAIGERELATGGVTSTKISNGAVSEIKLEDGAVSKNKIADGAVDGLKIAGGAVTNSKIGDNAVQFRNIASFSVREGHLAADAVKNVNIIDKTISKEKVNFDQVTVNSGSIFPMMNAARDGSFLPVADEVNDVILDVVVNGARKNKYYGIVYIADGLSGSYGFSLAEYDKGANGGFAIASRKMLTTFSDNGRFNEPASSSVVHRTVNVESEGIVFDITYDRSKIVGKNIGIDIANTSAGKGRGLVIHPSKYIYRDDAENDSGLSQENRQTYVDKKADRLFVYNKVSNGNYVGVEITHYQKEAVQEKMSNYDFWGVRTIKEYSKEGNSFTPIRSIIDDSTPTTMDLMIREAEEMDYMGGIHHGDEVNEEVMLLIDNMEVDMTTTGFFAANEVRLMQRNKLFRDSLYTEGVMEHLGTVGKEHIFNKDGYTLSNTVTWHESINIYQAFLGALSMFREDKDGVTPLWHKAYNDVTHTTYDLTTVGGQMPTAENVDRIVLTGANFGCVMEIDRMERVPGNSTWIANFAPGNSKVYSSYVPSGYTTSVNEVWRQKNNFKFEFGV